ncbi:MAG TPA: pitrilysin family protein [Oxalicibacterium sp.]|nr:pitrilysin family protein [Oxalicibacterium sp.]
MTKFLALVLLYASCTLSHAAIQIQSWTLANGARVLFVENHSLPILDVSVDFDAGTRRDPPGKSGVAAMTNALLARGIRQVDTPAGSEPALTEAQISDAFADIAAQRGARIDNDRSGVTLRTLVNHREVAIPLLARMLAQPAFPQDVLERDKARAISELKESLTMPEAIAERAFTHLLYGNHPYAAQPTEASLQAITRDDLVAFHAAHFVANRAVVAMIGDITREQADRVAQQLTQRLPQGAPLPALPPVTIAAGSEQRIPHPASQAHILIGMPGSAYHDPDHYALTVGNYILGGGGFASRLTHEVREKRGLTYGVYSFFNPMAQRGPFQIGLQTQKQQAERALQVVRSTLADFLRDGPTAAEVQSAKDNLIGGFALRLDSNRKILGSVAAIGFYDLPLDYLDRWPERIASVTAADVQAAFNRKLQLDKLSTVVVGGSSQ